MRTTALYLRQPNLLSSCHGIIIASLEIAMPEPNVYKIFKAGITPDIWVCTICSNFKIQINPLRYNKLNSGERRAALETDADKHITQHHSGTGPAVL